MRPGAQELARQPTLTPAHRSLGAGAKPMQSLSAVRKEPSSEGGFAFCHHRPTPTPPAAAAGRGGGAPPAPPEEETRAPPGGGGGGGAPATSPRRRRLRS